MSLKKAPHVGSLGGEGGVGRGKLFAKEAVMLGDVPVCEQYRMGHLGNAVCRCKRSACPVCQSSGLVVGSLITTYAGVGRGPQQRHGFGRGSSAKNLEGQ